MEGLKDWTKNTIVEEDEKLNKVRIAKKQKTKKKTKTKQKIRKDAIDVVHKEFYKIYYKTSIIIYGIDMYRHCFLFLILHWFHYLVINTKIRVDEHVKPKLYVMLKPLNINV